MHFGFEGLGEAKMNLEMKVGAEGSVEVVIQASGIRRSLHIGPDCNMALHWATVSESGGWVAPTRPPANAHPFGDGIAMRTSLGSDGRAILHFPGDSAPKKIAWVLFVEYQGQQHWLKASGNTDFVADIGEEVEKAKAAQAAQARIKGAGAAPGGYSTGPGGLKVAARPAKWEELQAAIQLAQADSKDKKAKKTDKAKKPPISKGEFEIEQGGELKWTVVQTPNEVTLFMEISKGLDGEAVIQLHWGGVPSGGGDWCEPDPPPKNAQSFGDGKAMRTLVEQQSRAMLKFPAKTCPGAICFVLYITVPGGEAWLKSSGGSDFLIDLTGESGDSASAGPKDNSIGKQVCDAEFKYSHWSQFQRLCLMSDFLQKGANLTAKDAAWITTDLKLAQQRVLDWYRKRGYQPKDFAAAQERIGGILSSCVTSAATPQVRTLLRLCVNACPRGNSRGADDIRHGILNIMRNHGIKEGHRPGIECKFIEQWHQKLHTNSAPDDIVICEGYLAFLRSGNPDDLFRVIWEVGKLTREDLGKMCECGFKDHTKSGGKGLNVTPLHLPQLYKDMEGYLGLLKHIHGGSSLFDLCEACKGQFPDHGAECMAFEVYHSRDDPMVMGRITELRRQLKSVLWKRDVLMLDVALEDQLRMLAERVRPAELNRDDLLGYLGAVLEDLVMSREDPSLTCGLEMFKRLTVGDHGNAERWSTEWCKLMMSASERLTINCTTTIDMMVNDLQSCADQMYAASQSGGSVLKPDKAPFEAFGEETARCLTERVVAQVFRCLTPMLRRGAGLGPWEVTSRGSGNVVGTVKVMKELPTEAYSQKVIAVLQTLTGWEDIPLGIVAILLPSESSVDVLSHVAIRARNQNVLLASCDDDSLLNELRGSNEKPLAVQINAGGDVTWSKASGAVDIVSEVHGKASAPVLKMAPIPPKPSAKALSMDTFVANSKSLGGKSLNLAKLKPQQSTDYDLPISVTIPFGIFEEVLAMPENEDASEELVELLEDERWSDARQLIISKFVVPEQVSSSLTKELSKAGAPLKHEEELWQRALKAVWASKWTDRAVSSRKSMGVQDSALFLAVLVQPLRGGRYAFVIHTKSPLVGAASDEALVEVCVGLGESLVSNSPGRPLSASVSSKGISAIHSYPSKPIGVFVPDGGSLMFRSDSNGEDLEGFAGAGLYDSVAAIECPHRHVDYCNEPLIFDRAFRDKLLTQLFEVGRRVEKHFNGMPQDIEGAVDGSGKITVTQSRPQV